VGQVANRIHNLLTRYANRDDAKVPIIMMGLDVDELDDLDAFMSQVAATFRTQRLLSPPETRAMFVTLTGPLTATEFKRRWTEQVARDPVLGQFMARMDDASVLHGERDGTVIEHISLIHRSN
jgi:hypothetical protein